MGRFPARALALASLLLTAAPACAADDRAPVELTYLGNEGVLIAAGERRVLIDALYGDGIDGYVVLGAPYRERLETASADFAGVDIILATHRHGDHFDAAAVARYLGHEPGAIAVTTPETASRLAPLVDDATRVRGVLPAEGERVRLSHRGIGVEVLNLHHGRGRDVQNAGFLVDIGGLRIAHLGDTEITLAEIEPLGLDEAGIDVALVPYWHLLGPEGRAMVTRGLAPRRVVALHLPAADAPATYFGEPGGLEALIETIEAHHPGAVPFRAPLDRLGPIAPGG